MRISDWSSDVCSSDLAALTDRPLAAVVGEFEGKGFAEFKQALTEVAVARLGPMGEEMKRMVNDPQHVDSVLHEGAARARDKIGRASCRERVGQYVYLSVVAV